MTPKFKIVVISLLCFAACKPVVEVQQTKVNTITAQTPIQENAIQAVLWQERAAEYKALCYQAYNTAHLQLDMMLQEYKDAAKPLAIITDLDETMMDNSPFNGKMIQTDKNYSKQDWIEWGEKRSAKPVPGSVEFFKYAASKGVEIFYVSNRYPEQRQATLYNLRDYGVPFVDDAHLMLRGEKSSKAERRAKVKQDFEVIMLIGDNLADFSDLYESQLSDRRNALTDSLKADFGARYIVLPNVIYGDWLNGIYNGRHDWTEAQKDSLRRSKVIGY